MTQERKYKDSLFRSVFNNEEALSSLYNAINGAGCAKPQDIKINTLQDTFFNHLKNDISFQIGNQFIVLKEHQSTINENMPMRCLLYIAQLYREMIDEDFLYKEKADPVPTPKFYVFYNGEKEQPEKKVMRLSDAFVAEGGMLELEVAFYNINVDKNRELMGKCRILQEYSIFIDLVRQKIKAGMERKQAIKETIEYCRKNDILKDFLDRHAMEVYDMISFEWNMDTAKKVWRKEAREEAIEETQLEVAEKMLRDNVDHAIISKYTDLPLEKIARLAEANA